MIRVPALVAVLVSGIGAPAGAQDRNGLSASVKIMLQRAEGERAEPCSAFVLGDGFFCTFWVKGYRTDGTGAPKLKGTWELRRPDGTLLPLENTDVGADTARENGPDGVLLRPVPGLKLTPNEVAGTYTAKVTVQDLLSGGSCSAEAPIYMFLTPGARDLGLASAPGAALALDTTLLAPGLWDMTVEAFLSSTRDCGFSWVSEARDEICSKLPGLTFLGDPLTEVKVRFAAGRPAEARLCFYNRGDAGVLPYERFTADTERLTGRLKTLAGVAQNLSPTTGKAANQKQTILVWRRGPSVLRLDYAWTVARNEREHGKFLQPEYINMALLPAKQARTSSEMAGTQQASVSLMTLRSRVKRQPNGDVLIEGLRMVDQGEKGYCAAASTERILDYYGTDVDQHELAQRMLMETGGGASYEAIVRGLRAMALSLKVQVKVLIDEDARAFVKLIEDYNRDARKAGMPQLDPRLLNATSANNGNIWALFDKDLFLKSRANERVAIEKFLKKVQEKIDAGIPVCQCCIVGILPEEAKVKQEPGGHMRIIIGYNAKTREILYTDTWGPGHECKRLGLPETFAITTGLFTLEPR